MNFHTGLR